jgi:hypothetical protein
VCLAHEAVTENADVECHTRGVRPEASIVLALGTKPTKRSEEVVGVDAAVAVSAAGVTAG